MYTRFINGKMFPGDPLRDRFGGASSSSDMPDMHGFNNVCLITAFRNAGIPAPDSAHGPFAAIADGKAMLAPYG